MPRSLPAPLYRWRGWVGRWEDRLEWRGPVADRATLANLWQIAASREDGTVHYSPDTRIQVIPEEETCPA